MDEIRTATVDGEVYVCLADLVARMDEGCATVPFFDVALWLRRMLKRTQAGPLEGE